MSQKQAYIRNSVYCTNNRAAAEVLIESLRTFKYDQALDMLETALNAAEYKGKASPEALRSAIKTSFKILNSY